MGDLNLFLTPDINISKKELEIESDPDSKITICGVSLKRFSNVQNSQEIEKKPMNFLTLSSIKSSLELICLGVKHKKPILIKGPVGSGKSAIVQHIANLVGRHVPPDFVTVQLGEHMDSRVSRIKS